MSTGRPAALLALALALLAQGLLQDAGGWGLRRPVFDIYQRLAPRSVERFTARVVDVDEASLREFGQWPWPRYRMAELVEATARLGALAIGIDVFMPEEDRFSPGALASEHPGLDAALRERLATLPSNDDLLAETLRRVPVVVARVGRPADHPAPAQPVRFPPMVAEGGDPLPHLAGFDRVQLNVPEIEGAASGHGLVNALFEDDGVARRVPVVARVGDELGASLGLELLRVATGVPFVAVLADERGVRGVRLGDSFRATDADGGLTLHFAPSDPRRRISAADVLGARVPADALAGQVAIIGVTALGTTDAPPTPISGRMDGVEIQVQAVESLLDGVRLVRPPWAPWIEALALALGGLVLVLCLPVLGPRFGLLLAAGVIAAYAGGGLAAFAARQWLLDPSLPASAAAAVSVLMLAALLAEEKRRARELDAALERERIASARVAGELNAARNIQMGILPDPDNIPGLPGSVSVAARLEPARRVGGDLYDAFMVDEHRLFFAVGDVSGKGIPASLFMALSKSLCKSVVLRARGTVAERITIANTEIARENPELLFVTVAAGLLDTRTGDLELCVAGHDAPWLLRSGAAPRELEGEGGPPLCVVDDFEYPVDRFHLDPGDTLLITTDGITEAQDPQGALYGRERLLAQLVALDPAAELAGIVTEVVDDVDRFAAGAEPADDVTVLVVRYKGADAVT
jgi:serine phosphatase RsbU (regulator of sigma subunit)